MNHVIPFFDAVGMERGSERYIRRAADPTLFEDVSGMYFVSGKEKQEGSPPVSLDPVV
jgi:hypothetical protein